MTYDGVGEAYDLLYEAAGKDYSTEAARVAEIVLSRRARSTRLVDFGCGTGSHLRYLADSFIVEGVDSSQTMIERAGSKLRNVPLHVGDLRTFSLGRKFDAVTCLFSSIGNLYPLSEMCLGIANMARHLVGGGILVVEPWLRPGSTEAWELRTDAAQNSSLAVARTARSWTEDDGNKLCVEMHWVLARPEGTEVLEEHHQMGLYSDDQYRRAFESAGCTVEHDHIGLTGRGLFVATRRLVPPRRGRSVHR